MTIDCKVKSVSQLAPFIYKVVLTPPEPMPFIAGQYLMVVLGEKDKRPFSIASAPNERDLELHIGAADENPWALEVVTLAKQAMEAQGTLTITPAQGDAFLREETQRPLLLVAGGTGYTYVRSILSQYLRQSPSQPVFVYWGGRDESQLYALQELAALAQSHAQLTVVPVLEQAPSEWAGKQGNVLDAVMADFVSLEAYDIYLCGRFEMAGAAREQFSEQRGAHREHMYADAFAFI